MADAGPAVASTGRRPPVPRKHRRRNQAALVVSPQLFSDIAIQGLVNDVLVPFVVNRMIRRAVEK
jgi:hypothetical protein